MSSFKNSENIQKKEGGPDISVLNNRSSSVTLNELAMNNESQKRSLRKHPHMFYTHSFTFLYSRKGEMRGTQNEGLFSGFDIAEILKFLILYFSTTKMKHNLSIKNNFIFLTHLIIKIKLYIGGRPRASFTSKWKVIWHEQLRQQPSDSIAPLVSRLSPFATLPPRKMSLISILVVLSFHRHTQINDITVHITPCSVERKNKRLDHCS